MKLRNIVLGAVAATVGMGLMAPAAQAQSTRYRRDRDNGRYDSRNDGRYDSRYDGRYNNQGRAEDARQSNLNDEAVRIGQMVQRSAEGGYINDGQARRLLDRLSDVRRSSRDGFLSNGEYRRNLDELASIRDDFQRVRYGHVVNGDQYGNGYGNGHGDRRSRVWIADTTTV